MLSRYILRMAEYGERTVFIEQGLYRSRIYSYSEVVERALAFSHWLRVQGLEGQERAESPRILIWSKPGARWAMAFYGCVLAGAVAVPVDAGFSPGFLSQVIQRTHAALLITDSDGAKTLREQSSNLSITRFQIDEIEKLPPGPRGVSPPAQSRDALAEIVYTSGSTTQPRGVMITHGNLLANLEPVEREIRRYGPLSLPFRPIRFLHLIPLSHLFGQVMGLFIPQLLQSVVIFPESQSPGQLARIMRERRVSVMVSVPQQLEALGAWALAQLDGETAAKSEIDRSIAEHWPIPKRWWKFRRAHRALGWKMWAFVVGGAKLPLQIETLWSALGYAVIQGYGLTETAPAITITHPFKIRRGAVGRPLAGVETRIAPDGEILVRGPNVSPGYFGDPEATETVFTNGWLRTGDLGRFDEEGNLIYLGRKKEMIVTAEGLNVYPEEVERELNHQPAIRESAVVGKQTGESGGAGDPGLAARTLVHAVVVPTPGVARGEIEAAIEQSNRSLEPHQRIRGFSLWPVDSLPRTLSTGKLQRTAIAAWVNSTGTITAAATAPSAAQPPDWHTFLARLGVSPERIRPDARLSEDLGLSSLDRVELMTWIETQRYGADEEKIAQAATVADLEKALSVPPPSAGNASTGAMTKVVQEFQRPETTPGERERQGSEPHWPVSWPARMARELLQKLIAFPLLSYYVKVRIENRQKIETLRHPALIVSNHQSFFDAPVIFRALPAKLRRRVAPAMSAEAFSRHSRFALFLTRLFFNGYLISEDPARAQEALRHAGGLAEKGFSTLLFPEGARTWDGRLQRFWPGVGVMAERLGLPVVAVRVEGLFEVWPRTRRRPVRGHARVVFGDTFTLQPGETAATFTARLEEYFRNWS